jgi:hypothetical protein
MFEYIVLTVVGLAIGFGAQSLLQDWVKGFFILAENLVLNQILIRTRFISDGKLRSKNAAAFCRLCR